MRVLLALTALLLPGCITAGHVIAMRDAPAPRLVDIEVCSGFGCNKPQRVALAEQEWAEIAASFSPPPADAIEERRRVARAVAAFERIVAPKAGTGGDTAESAVFMWDATGQLDCIDETLNTGTYLRLLAEAGLLKFHDVGKPAHRGYIVDFVGPHNTATLTERAGGARFAIDSWFHANGEAPEVVPLALWKRNWKPDRSQQARADPASF